MNRKLEQPKITTYENVERVIKIIEAYIGDEYEDYFKNLAKYILDEFKIPYGKKKVIKLFEDNVHIQYKDTIIKDGKDKGRIHKEVTVC